MNQIKQINQNCALKSNPVSKYMRITRKQLSALTEFEPKIDSGELAGIKLVKYSYNTDANQQLSSTQNTSKIPNKLKQSFNSLISKKNFQFSQNIDDIPDLQVHNVHSDIWLPKCNNTASRSKLHQINQGIQNDAENKSELDTNLVVKKCHTEPKIFRVLNVIDYCD